MQFKSTRGVQQADVSDAADALIAEGLRPTIERVRQKMGRGSPNTVSPMLDTWFGTLGTRLAGNQSTPVADAIPSFIQEGMKKLWEMALARGREEASLQTAQIQAGLADERALIAAKADELVHREQLQAERMQANILMLDAARAQVEDLRAQHADLCKALRNRETELVEQRDKIDIIELGRAAERRKAADEFAQQALERGRADERAAVTERRLLQEVDRARQETKLFRASMVELEKQNVLQQRQWEETLLSRNTELSMALEQGAQKSRDIHALRDGLATANLKIGELKDLFDKQQLANELVIAQLTQALTNSKRKVKVRGLVGRMGRP